MSDARPGSAASDPDPDAVPPVEPISDWIILLICWSASIALVIGLFAILFTCT